MSPLDRKGVLKNQAGVAKQNIAEKELGGKEDNRHKASKRRLLLVMHLSFVTNDAQSNGPL